jgi:hypothetical protein
LPRGNRGPSAAVGVAGFAEHHSKQCRALQCELDVGDRDCGEVVGVAGAGCAAARCAASSR